MVRDFKELQQSIITEHDKPPEQHCPVFVGFGEIQPPALLIHGKLGLQPELDQLQLQAGLQTPEDSQLGCWVLPLSQLA